MKELTPFQQRQALEEFVARRTRAASADFGASLFAEQLAFIRDPAKRKAALCTRRAGKTWSIVTYMVEMSQRFAFCQIPYITLTRAQSKRNIWLTLQQFNTKHALGGKFNNNELSVTFPNGSVIFLTGANDEAEVERFRGGNYPLVVVDEVQSFRAFIRGMLESVLGPAVSDYEDRGAGVIVLSGTPGFSCAGLWWDITGNAGSPLAGLWSVHRWSVAKNVFHPWHKPGRLEQLRRENGWLPDNPTYLREYLGQWVHDSSRQVYKIAAINVARELPDRAGMTYVLGLDLGFEDATAFVVMAYSQGSGRVWVLESRQEQHLIPAAVAQRVQRYMERYDISRIVADSGGFGKGYVEEMKQRYGLPVIAAEKTRKLGYIELMNGDLQAGALQFYEPRNRELIDEMGAILYEAAEDGSPDRTTIDEKFPDHLSDACLYAWRDCRQYFYDPMEDEPRKGSPEAENRREDARLEAAKKRFGAPRPGADWLAAGGYSETGPEETFLEAAEEAEEFEAAARAVLDAWAGFNGVNGTRAGCQ